jgi:hypothetical protein
MLMAGLSDYFFGFWGSLFLGAGLTLLLAFLLFRKHSSRLLKILLLGLVAFFTIVYPLSGLLTDLLVWNSFDSLFQAGMIVYLFILAVFVRSKVGQSPAASQPPLHERGNPG